MNFCYGKFIPVGERGIDPPDEAKERFFDSSTDIFQKQLDRLTTDSAEIAALLFAGEEEK